MLDYLAPLDRIAEAVADHRAYLDEGYRSGMLLASGPRVPKDGGVLIAKAADAAALEKFFASDPFKAKGLAVYRFIEFEPVKRHPDLAGFFAD